MMKVEDKETKVSIRKVILIVHQMNIKHKAFYNKAIKTCNPAEN